MSKLPGDVIDIIKKAIISIIAEKGECPVAALAIYLKNLNDKRFIPKNWVGFKSIKAMFEDAPKFFILYYRDNKNTDLCVCLSEKPSKTNSENQSRYDSIPSDIDFPEYIRRCFSSEDCLKLREEIIGSFDMCMTDDCVLRSVMIYTYYWHKANGTIWESPEKGIVFHTGWYKNGFEPLYMVWTFKEGVPAHLFVAESSPKYRELIRMLGNRRPERPDFPRMIFDAEREIIPELGHIIKERFSRLPPDVFTMLRNSAALQENLRTADDVFLADKYYNYLCRHLVGCIADTRKRIRNGTDEAVRYWHKTTNTMCWLIPLRFGISEQVDLALVLEPTFIDNREVYRACTILPLKDALKCARVVGPVTADWLKDAWRQ